MSYEDSSTLKDLSKSARGYATDRTGLVSVLRTRPGLVGPGIFVNINIDMVVHDGLPQPKRLVNQMLCSDPVRKGDRL